MLVTATAHAVFTFSAVICLTALAAILVCRRRQSARRLAGRLVALFGIFACAAAYVWLDLGPTVDGRLSAEVQTVPLPSTPRSFDI